MNTETMTLDQTISKLTPAELKFLSLMAKCATEPDQVSPAELRKLEEKIKECPADAQKCFRNLINARAKLI